MKERGIRRENASNITHIMELIYVGYGSLQQAESGNTTGTIVPYISLYLTVMLSHLPFTSLHKALFMRPKKRSAPPRIYTHE